MTATGERALGRLAAFGALAALAAATWVHALLAEPPLPGALAAVAVSLGAAALLLRLADRRRGRSSAGAAGGASPTSQEILAPALAAAVAALAAIALGLDPRLLAPSGWGELAAGLGQGLSGLADADYPYSGQDPWVRTTIALGLALSLGLAVALGFRPGGHGRSGALAVLLVLYGVAATVNPPPAPLLWGAVLFALLACWLWPPRLELRAAPGALAALCLAALVGVGAAAALDAERPWLDWTSWRLPGDRAKVDFTWNHSYGPISWPREGTGLLRVESEDPHYWRTIVLDRFDGFRWEIETKFAEVPLELPSEVEPGAPEAPDPRWIERTTFTVGALDSGLLVAPGSVLRVDGLVGTIPGSGSTSLISEPLREGEEYSVTSYSPEPSAERLRAAPDTYARALRRYTRLELPRSLAVGAGPGVYATDTVTVPLRGEPVGAALRARLAGSAYGGIYALARRLGAAAPSTYEAVAEIERHLRERYSYSETPPERPLPLRAFLFGDRAGYCQQFSGSMALMLRMLGIPSRIASGFGPGEREDGGEAFQVSDRDAHSWVEVYFNGIGWVAFEPTPPAAPAGRELAALAVARAAVPAATRRLPARGLVIPTVAGIVGARPEQGGAGPWPALLAGLLLLAGLAAVAAIALAASLAARAARYRRLDGQAASAAQARELERALPRLGFPIPPGATLLGLERRFGSRRALGRYLSGLRAGRFGSGAAPPGPAERAALRRELAADRGPAGRLRALLAIPPGGPLSGYGRARRSD